MVSMFAPGLAQKLYGLSARVLHETHELYGLIDAWLNVGTLLHSVPQKNIQQWRDLTIS